MAEMGEGRESSQENRITGERRGCREMQENARNGRYGGMGEISHYELPLAATKGRTWREGMGCQELPENEKK